MPVNSTPLNVSLIHLKLFFTFTDQSSNRRNSSLLNPDCFIIALKVPLSSSLWRGTTRIPTPSLYKTT